MSWIRPRLHFNSSSEKQEEWHPFACAVPLDLTCRIPNQKGAVKEKQGKMVAIITEAQKTQDYMVGSHLSPGRPLPPLGHHITRSSILSQ